MTIITITARTARSVTTPSAPKFDEDDDRALSIHDAAAENNIRVLEMFLKLPDVDPDVLDERGVTPLMVAAWSGSVEAAVLLLEAGADPNAGRDTGFTALHYAAAGTNAEIVKVLLDFGADVNARDMTDDTPLMHAAREGTPEIALILLHYGADDRAADVIGATALHYASSVEMAALLLDGTAQINATEMNGLTPLDWAEINDNADLAEFLERHGGVRGAV